MDKSEKQEYIAQIKGKIGEFECEDTGMEQGIVYGLMWCIELLEHGAVYANEHIAMPRHTDADCGCGCREGGC